MQPERWDRIKDIFEVALETEPSLRKDYLHSVCGEDSDLQLEVERLLSNYEDANDSFLEEAASGLSQILGSLQGRDDPAFSVGELAANRFRILTELGKGGMGEVYEAQDLTVEGLHVALKTIRPQIASSDAVQQRFRKELLLAREVTHPNVCRINDVFTHDAEHTGRVLLLSMELLSGETLRDRVRAAGPLPPHEAVTILSQVADGLAAAHSVGVLHLDLKPANIMLVRQKDGSLRVVVMDFGLARSLEEAHGPQAAFGGTPAYMPPEQIAGKETDKTADVYTWGMVAWEVLTGKPLREGCNSLEKAGELARLDPPNLRALRADVDPRICQLVLRCLQRDPSKRPASAEVLAIELEQILKPPAFYQTRRGIAALAAAAALLLGGGGYLLRDQFTGPKQVVLVRPLDDRTDGALGANFVNGLSSEIRRTVSFIPRIRVIAPATTSELESSGVSYQEIGRRFGATRVVSGSVRQMKDQLIVRATMIDPKSGRVVWSRDWSYQKSATLPLQLSIAAELASALGGESIALENGTRRGRTRNEGAWKKFVEANELKLSRQHDDLQRAVELYQQAITLDPNFAGAWAGMAEAHELLGISEDNGVQDVRAQALSEVRRSLEIDPDLPEGHMELAVLLHRFTQDAKEAELHYKRAIELNPNSGEAFRLYAGFLLNQEKLPEALHMILRAEVLDPLSHLVLNTKGAILSGLKRYDEAVVCYQQVLAIRPDFPYVYILLASAELRRGNLNGAIRVAEEGVRRGKGEPKFRAQLADLYARAGHSERARIMARELEAEWIQRQFSPIVIANIYRSLGDRPKMYEWLHTAENEHDLELVTTLPDADYDPFRAEPEFKKIVEATKSSR